VLLLCCCGFVRGLWWFGGRWGKDGNRILELKYSVALSCFCDRFVVVLWMVFKMTKVCFSVWNILLHFVILCGFCGGCGGL